MSDELTDCLTAVYLNLSSKLQFVARSPSLSRCSYDSTRPPSPTLSISSVSTTTSKFHFKTRFPSLSENHATHDASDSPFSKKRPPILRLSSPDDGFSQPLCSGTKLDAASGSPGVMDADSSQASDASDGDSTDRLLSPISPPITPISPSTPRSYTLPIPRRKTLPSYFIETSEPTFKVTSEATTRRLKMERIRKRLGECVPVEAVFPDESPDGGDEDEDYVKVTAEKPPQVNVDLRPRWRSSSAFVAFDVIYECPDEHGDEGLANGLSLAPRISKNPTPTDPRNSCAAPARRPGKLVKKSRREACF